MLSIVRQKDQVLYVMAVASKDIADGTCKIQTLGKTVHKTAGTHSGVRLLREALKSFFIEHGAIVAKYVAHSQSAPAGVEGQDSSSSCLSASSPG